MNFCKQCCHFRAGISDPKMHYAKCSRTLKIEPNPVSGEMEQKMSFCDTQRQMYGECGPEGKFFEARVFEAVS